MKFRLPDGCLGLMLEGKPVAMSPDHTIEAAASDAAALAVHGIVRADLPAESATRPKGRAAKGAP